MADNEWKKVRLGELVTIKHGYPFKSEFFSEFLPGQTIVVNIGNFKYTGGFRFESTTLKGYIGDYPKEFVLSPDDILLVMTCQTSGGEILGIPGRIPSDGQIYLHNQRMGKVIITNPARVERNFLYWLFLSPDFNRELFTSASGTKILHTSPNRIEAFCFRLPPLSEQTAIAHLLGTLDDKIELNQQMNRNLEAIASAIFKSWFVDFDPVRAKMEGRQPVGMDAATAALFPDSFENSSLGEIPRGWRVGKVEDISIVSSGKRPEQRSSEPLPEMQIPIYGGGGIMGYVQKPLYSEPIIITGRVGTLGLVFRISSPCWASDNTLVFQPQNNDFYEYIYFQLKGIDFESLNRGSTQPLVTQTDLKTRQVIIPSKQVISRFNEQVARLFQKVDFNEQESHTLATIRDTLLPKLMSGEIQVKEAEKILEDVA